MAVNPPLTLLLFLLILCTASHARFITLQSQPSDLISDGIHDSTISSTPFLKLPFTASETCEQTYGFMPCTSTIWGNMFLIFVYGYLMFLAATYLSAGSELLLEILGPGIVGGLFLPMLGALPDAMLILEFFGVSGLSGTVATAQEQISVGMGLLAGSTVMLLTIIWGSCVIVGKCDIRDSVAVDSTDTKGLSLTESGVSTDIWTSYGARIMAISVLPFILVQVPQVLSSTSERRLAVLIALIFSFSMLIAYCLYQVFQPWVQKRKIAFAKHKHVISGLLKNLTTGKKFFNDEGEPDAVVLKTLFDLIDENKDGYISHAELKALIIGIQFENMDLDHNEAVEKVMKEFDTSNNNRIELDEFVAGFTKWLNEAKRFSRNQGPQSAEVFSDFHVQTRREHYLLGDQSDEVVEGVENARWTTIKAVLFLLLGSIIAAVFADPLVGAVNGFSDATGIPTFFISFIALPLATNSSEAVSAIIFATRKKLRTASLTFSELYGAVTMNNLLCLSVFLALVYARGLTWDFSAEVLVIVIVCVVMGAFASFRTTFPLWTCSLAFLLYPFSLVLVYVLDYVFGWT